MNTKTKGQSLVEFALILPILLLLILGIIEGARIIWAYITVQNAAREAARYAVTGQPYDDMGNPWTLRPDRYSGCSPDIQQGRLVYGRVADGEGECAEPNDRVDAIMGVALERGKGLGIDQSAVFPDYYTATGYIDEGGTYGVRVFGQETLGGSRVDYAGTEGLNVLVQVYYNVRLLDPLYAAIIPNGYVYLRGEVQMQNEGIDTALGAIPPEGIAPPEAPEGQPPPPGQANKPVVISLDGSTVDAGSPLNVRLDYHPKNQSFDIYLYSASLGYFSICQDVDSGPFGSKEVTCNVPARTTPGSYRLVSIAAGGDRDPANHVAEGDFIDVTFPGEPLIQIADGNRWPAGSRITINLYGHPPCPPEKPRCPPNQEYDIALIGGVYTQPGQVIGTVRVDDLGSASLNWTIPTGLAPGTYTVLTYEKNTTDPVIAQTSLDIALAEIVVQGGNRWPVGTTIRVHLRGHAPNRTYRLQWIDRAPGGKKVEFGPVDTDKFGNSEAPVQFPIPFDTHLSPPKHLIISIEEGGTEEVARTEVEVFEPEDAYIVVVGGDTWPAGSLIQIELHKHSGGRYNLYFDDTDKLIDGDFLPNNSGFYQTTYVIPLTTDDGEYIIRSRLTTDDDTDVATRPIQVESVPLIRVKEGNIVQPGSDITIQLLHHPGNDSFRIYLDDNYLFSMPSDALGNGERIYDLSNLPGLEGEGLLLESRRDGLTVASTEISIIAADLEITNIEFPPGPPINQEIPVTVTVRNNSPVSVSGEYFDVDLYFDPLHPPTPGSQFPPGDYKRWMHSVPPMDTVDVLFNLTLRGTDHTVYGRVDTSNYIEESDETNNIYKMMISGGCVAEIRDAFSSSANWTGVGYGDADNGSFSVGGGSLNLVSDGTSAFGSSDNMYLAYYKPETISGDFEVRVRMVEGPGDDPGESNWARGGLEIRGDVGSASSAKVELAVVNSQHVSFRPGVQSAYRDGGDATRPADAALDVEVAYPVWLRIVRSGDRFTYYYSDSDSATPPADNEWISHGSVQMPNMGKAVAVGLFNASYHQSNTDTSSFEKLYICLKGAQGPPPGEDFPPGLAVCTGNVIQNGGFEGSQLAPWRAPNGAVNDDFSPGYEGQQAALMYTYRQQEPHHQPVLAQTFTMPDWVISSTTTINLSLYQCARDYPGSGPEPDDHLNVGLRSTGNTPEFISDPILVADGDTANSSTCLPTDYTLLSSDLAEAVKAAGGNTQDYAGQTLELYVYDTSSDPATCRPPNGFNNPACYETHFYLDNVGLDICTSQPVPDPEPGKAYQVGGPLRVFIGGAPQPKQGVRVWTYKQNGDLLTTYSLHDSTYYFYNVDPGEYVIYSEYWDGPNLYSAFTTVRVQADQSITDLSLLLR